MRTRAIHRAIRLAVILTALSALLSMPLATQGARGDDVTASVERVMPQVSTGGLMKFHASLANGANPTLANVRFDASVKALSGSSTNAVFVSATIPCASQGGGAIACQLPANLPGGRTASFELYFTAPSVGEPIVLDGRFSAEGRRNNPGASTDTWFDQSSPVTVRTDSAFFGTWQRAHTQPLPTIAIGTGGPQQTSLQVPAVSTDYPLVVQQVADAGSCGESTIGKAVELSVANGAALAQPLQVKLVYRKTILAGRTPHTIRFFHLTDAGTCLPIPGDCAASPTFCFTAGWSGSGGNKKLVAHLTLPSNGLIKGW
jgi:hypothetical protein